MSSEISAKISGILQHRDSTNRFMPTHWQCEELAALLEAEPSIQARITRSLRHWLSFISEHTLGLDLFFQHENGGKQKRRDMERRAQILIDKCLQAPQTITRIVYMDGHGRFTYVLLTALLRSEELADRVERGELKLCVIDLNKNVHRWHQLFFPAQIDKEQRNVFSHKPAAGDFIYMNFCGIGGADGLKKLEEYADKYVQALGIIMVSMCMRGYKKADRTEDWLPQPLVDQNKRDLTKMTEGNLFITFIITPAKSLDRNARALDLLLMGRAVYSSVLGMLLCFFGTPATSHDCAPVKNDSTPVMSLDGAPAKSDKESAESLDSMKLTELRKFAKQHNLDVKLDVGGIKGRPKSDLVRDIKAAMTRTA